MSKNASWFKSNFGFSSGPDPPEKPTAAPTKRKAETSDTDSSDDDCQITYDNKPHNICIDWLKKFEPKEVAELSIHPKKLEELRNWLQIQRTKPSNKILVIEGPTGSGKTTAFKLIAEHEFGFRIAEWITPTDLEKDLLLENVPNYQNQDFVSYESQIESFSDFIFTCSRYDSIFDRRSSEKHRLVLVKDFPNIFFKKPEEFWKILANYSNEGLAPLIFILTETQSKALNIAYNLFPDKIRVDFGMDSISINPVSVTMMKRGVKRILQMIDNDKNLKSIYMKPSEETINGLVVQSSGDIRSLILNLNIESQKGDFKIPAKKSKKTAKKLTKVERGLGKNEGLTLLHAVGRVMYPKYELNRKTNMMELTHQPEDIAQAFSSQPKNFVRLLHSNYQKNFSSIEEAAEASEMFSLADCIESEYRDFQLTQVNLNFIIRSVMVINKNPSPGFRPITAYANKKWKNSEEASRGRFKNLGKLVNNGHLTAPNDFFCDYSHFLKIIEKK